MDTSVLRFLLLTVAGWMSRRQQLAIEFLLAETGWPPAKVRTIRGNCRERARGRGNARVRRHACATADLADPCNSGSAASF